MTVALFVEATAKASASERADVDLARTVVSAPVPAKMANPAEGARETDGRAASTAHDLTHAHDADPVAVRGDVTFAAAANAPPAFPVKSLRVESQTRRCSRPTTSTRPARTDRPRSIDHPRDRAWTRFPPPRPEATLPRTPPRRRPSPTPSTRARGVASRRLARLDGRRATPGRRRRRRRATRERARKRH